MNARWQDAVVGEELPLLDAIARLDAAALQILIVTDAEGPNDGVVSITSATYGESTAVWDGDHLSLVNWPHPRGLWEDRAAHYGALVQRLADEGF